MKIIIMISILIFSGNVYSFDFSLDYHGADVSKIKKMGCNCDTQTQVDSFISEYYKRLARELQRRGNSMPVGKIDRNSTISRGFFGAFTYDLASWLVPGDTKEYDRVIIYINWPEFGGG